MAGAKPKAGPSLVPFPRLFALLGYTVASLALVYLLLDLAAYGSLVVYSRYELRKHGLEGHCRGRSAGHCGSWIGFDVGSASDIYKQYPWADEFWKQELARRKRMLPYYPLRMWQNASWQSPMTHVDHTPWGNFRRTVAEEGSCAGEPFEVWVFGGSSVFGYGVPDFATVASYLSQELSRDGRCVAVRNFGSEAYVSNQEVLLLVELLKSGERPAAVVFLDGFNDSYCLWTAKRPANSHCQVMEEMSVFGRRSAFAQWIRPGKVLEALQTFSPYFSSGKPLVHAMVSEEGNVVSVQMTPGEVDQRAAAILDNYEHNIDFVQQMAHAYGFQAFFFWQPSLYHTGKKLDWHERAALQLFFQGADSYAAPYARASYRLAEERGHNGKFAYLGNLFDDQTEPVFIDCVHLGPEGNRSIALRIAESLQSSAQSGRPAASVPRLAN
ncbi:MAG: hypothetical protein M3O85_07250 [Acidobacteriota bacterium]|nr:hypothetical protein [Acidobacteriota bacterium]